MSYYAVTTTFIPGTTARAEQVNAELAAIQEAFGFLPTNTSAVVEGTATFVTESGSGNAYEVTFSPVRTSYTDGASAVFVATHTNTGAATLKFDSLSTANIVNTLGNALVAGDIINGMVYECRYDSANNRFVLMNWTDQASVAGAAASAAAALVSENAAAASAAAALVSENAAEASAVLAGAGTITGDLNWSGVDNPNIIGGDTNGVLSVVNESTTVGPYMRLYGSTHTTRADDFALGVDSTDILAWDASASVLEITETVTFSGLIKAGSSGVVSNSEIMSVSSSIGAGFESTDGVSGAVNLKNTVANGFLARWLDTGGTSRGSVHVSNSTSEIVYTATFGHSFANPVTIESANGSLTIKDTNFASELFLTSPDTGQSWIYFGGASDPDKGRIGFSDSSGAITLYTNNTVALSIASDGNVAWTSGNTLYVDNATPGSAAKGWAVRDNSSVGSYIASATSLTTSVNHAEFYNPNGTVGSISTNGSATTYSTSSDYRLKNITGSITNSGAYIDSLNPVEGTWKVDGSVFVGLIAHEVQEASRTVVATGKKDGEEMQGMDYSSAEIIANLIAEAQSLRGRVAELEAA